ncbi:MAG: bifunctional adenosylcobinamide kinase/adenosylcobinamide-phosphate guanylyltransferase [Chloroflexi bacterium]|nr:bifunctional adenosylcobinamide kinase/adenosylcobinamide-phosphate guanylyltransferase [Chloroflexota bacterium]OJV88751.1 MAG: bifunctional adenosylcobinamide kinase/adenosylcobinamide-phosphate guanylyltransferase [Chloroflexi bacterium 54-19]
MTGTAGKITLVLGGARSGKSTLAEKIAHKRAGDDGVLYVATLQPLDAEMEARVVTHRASRPANWRTLETPYEVAAPVFSGLQAEKLVLLDCLTLWTSNLILREMMPGFSPEVGITEDLPEPEPNPAPNQPVADINYGKLEVELVREIEQLVAGLKERRIGLVMVSNEVGMGLVPPYPLGRAYRDLLGRLNQGVAALSDEVFLVVAGIPVDLKKFQAEID